MKEISELIEKNIEQPRMDYVLITLRNEPTDLEFGNGEDMLNELQHVIAIGPMVRDLEVGDKVRIDLEKLSVKVIEYGEEVSRLRVSPIMVDDEICALISDRLIKTIIKNK